MKHKAEETRDLLMITKFIRPAKFYPPCKIDTRNTLQNIWYTRSFAALRAADLDWIVGSGHSWGGYILGCSQRLATCLRHSAWIGPDLTLFFTDWGSRLTFEKGEGGRAGITEKCHLRGVTTDLLEV